MKNFVAAILLLYSGVCFSECAFKKGEVIDYDGSLAGKYKIHMSITNENGKLVSQYFYASMLKDINLSASMPDSNSIVLIEKDHSGKDVAVFEGNFIVNNRHPNDNACDKLEGIWYQLKDPSKKLNFRLNVSHAWIGKLGRRYENAGVEDDELINKSATQLRDSVIKNDPEKVLRFINLPVNALVGEKTISIKTKEQFIKFYPYIFDKTRRQLIAEAIPRAMMSRYDGIMLGSGVIWFDSAGKIINL